MRMYNVEDARAGLRGKTLDCVPIGRLAEDQALSRERHER